MAGVQSIRFECAFAPEEDVHEKDVVARCAGDLALRW
jgi:hypothetical protein